MIFLLLARVFVKILHLKKSFSESLPETSKSENALVPPVHSQDSSAGYKTPHEKP